MFLPEVRFHCPDTPYILVGTKTDLREDPNNRGKEIPLTYKEGRQLAMKMGATQYIECSALQGIGLHDVFDQVIRLII
jgi:GTPase SAR1 family protein